MQSAAAITSAKPAKIAEMEDIPSRAIDLVHLAQQTLGDRELEIELLTLFERQAGIIMARLRQEGGDCDKWRHDLSHTLKGSARAVGAMRVAAAAQYYEDAMHVQSCVTVTNAAIDQLGGYVSEAQLVIRDLVDAS